MSFIPSTQSRCRAILVPFHVLPQRYFVVGVLFSSRVLVRASVVFTITISFSYLSISVLALISYSNSFLNLVAGLPRMTSHLISEGSYRAPIMPLLFTSLLSSYYMQSTVRALVQRVEIVLVQSFQEDRHCTRHCILDAQGGSVSHTGVGAFKKKKLHVLRP